MFTDIVLRYESDCSLFLTVVHYVNYVRSVRHLANDIMLLPMDLIAVLLFL